MSRLEVAVEGGWHPLAGPTVTIGRSGEATLPVDHVLVSREHGVLNLVDGRWLYTDLRSSNGSFHNGVRVHQLLVEGEMLLRLGHPETGAALYLRGTPTGPPGATASSWGAGPSGAGDPFRELVAEGLRVVTASGVQLLENVSLRIPPGSMVALLGPSGSGKSTLVGALNGQLPPTAGRVTYGGLDTTFDRDLMRQRVGSVPQDDLVHAELTVGESLRFAAELRFPPDVSPEQREARVTEVLHELGLTERRDVRVRNLSGGQRKRVSVALELLTRPSLLFLDEPTSGLDPGLERSMMEQLRALADGGRIVVVITHSVESLHLCDLVVCLAPGGRLAYVGPPGALKSTFGVTDLQQVYAVLQRPDIDWAVYGQVPPGHPAATTPEAVRAAVAAADKHPQSWWRAYSTFTRRYSRVLLNDRRTLALLLIGAPVLGLMLLLRLPPGALEVPPEGEQRVFSQAALVLFLLVLGLTQLSAGFAIREIVKELPIYRRERAVGASITAYVASKATVLGGLAMLQAAIVVLVATARQRGPGEGLLLPWGRGELVVVAALTGFAAVALALLCSALVTSTDRVAILLPAIVGFHALAAAGPIFPSSPEVPVLDQAAYLSSAQWGFAASASTAELNQLQAVGELGRVLAEAPLQDVLDGVVVLPERTGDSRYNHDRETWLLSMGVLALMSLTFLAATALALRRYDLP